MNIAMAKMKMEKRTGDVIIKIDNGGEQNFKSRLILTVEIRR